MEPSSSLRARAGGLEVAPPVYADAQATLGDPERVAVLEATGLLDSEAEEAFDRLTRLAVRLVGVPAAFVSLVDAQRDFYKSACGFGEPLASARELTGPTFCHYTVQQATPLVIPDTAADPTWRAVPTVQTLGVAAYVGIPLVVDGQSIGAFCAIDMSPRAWSGDEIEILTELAASAQREIELRVAAATARQTTERLKEQQATLGAAVEQMRRQQLELERSNMQLQEQQVELEAQAAALQEGNANLECALADAVRARRQAEQARSATEAAHVRTASLLEATADAYFALDEQLRVVAVNGAMERSTGLLREAMLGAEFLTLFPGAAGTDFERHYRCAVTERVEAHFTHDYSDGRLELVVEVDAYPATDGGVSVFWRDITEHVRAESALRASEARYRTLTEAVPVQVWTARPDGQLDFVSPRTIAYFDASAEQVLGTGWATYVHPDDLPAAIAEWKTALATGTPYETEFRLRMGETGEYRWHLARALPERDARGTVVAWVGSNTDVDAERRARAEAEAARGVAEAANRAKSEFLAVMSHELRTPLNAIGGYAELLQLGVRGSVTPEQRADLERIQKSQRHLLGLINGVLNFAKVDAGAAHYNMGAVELAEVLVTCEALVLPQVQAKGHAFDPGTCEPALRVHADREKVQQILLNLLSNAVKFTDPGGRIAIAVIAPPTDARVSLTVTDTGHGIAPDLHERIFEPFVQVDATLTRTQQGTGLGLAISRDLAWAMGGDLTVVSTVGEGSVFTLTLPRVVAA
jgi:PAS domain S-box-containing protein